MPGLLVASDAPENLLCLEIRNNHENTEMSGGHFNYSQYKIREIAEDIERLIAANDDKTPDEWGSPKGYGFPPEIIERLRETAHTLEQAADMAQRVDRLLWGADGEESFLSRWEEDVRPYWQQAERNGVHSCHSKCQRPPCVQRRRIHELESEIRATITENLHLADGDECTLKRLKDVIDFQLPPESETHPT